MDKFVNSSNEKEIVLDHGTDIRMKPLDLVCSRPGENTPTPAPLPSRYKFGNGKIQDSVRM
ncbi:MAG: hypothetical protein A2032_02645 [Chloroflexi bacterium RBG_19FT_COMBO_49_13]|nr:MAG: hypothetical protein A2032_02645 [Chloroflexi bacterium RBG_19FT_COMBO_49_13]